MAVKQLTKQQYRELSGGNITRSGGLRSMSKQEYENLKRQYSEVNIPLQTTDGTSFGNISRNAYRAIENNTLDSYTPVSDEEKNALSEFRKTPTVPLSYQDKDFGKISYDAYQAISKGNIDSYSPHSDEEKNIIGNFKSYATEKLEEEAKAERINSNPVFARYNIDPADFSMDDMFAWAKQHNHEFDMYNMDGFLPIRRGGFLGIGSEIVATDEEVEDAKVLYQLALNNDRAKESQTDQSSFMSAAIGFADGMTFGLVTNVADWRAESDYQKAGLDENYYISNTQRFATTLNEHPYAYIGGNVGGSVLATKGVSGIVSGATSSIKGFSTLSKATQSAINNSITFGTTSGVRSAISTPWTKEAWDANELRIQNNYALQGKEYQTRPYSTWRNVGNVAIDTLTGAAAGFLGTKAGGYVAGKLYEKLMNTKLDPSIIAGLTSVSGGLTSSFIDTSIRIAGNFSASVANGQKYSPDWESIATDALIDGVSVALSGVLSYKRGKAAATSNTTEDKFEFFTKEDMVSEETLKARYRTLAKSIHPDVAGFDNGSMAKLTSEYNRAKNMVGIKETTSVLEKIKNFWNNKKDNKTTSGSSDVVKEAVAVLNSFAEENDAETVKTVMSVNFDSTKHTSGTGISSSDLSVTPTTSPSVVTSSVADTNSDIPASSAIKPVSTVAPIAASEESEEIASADTVVQFIPKTASKEAKQLEKTLISQGADDASRREILTAALEIEQAISGTSKTISSVYRNVSAITSDAVAKIRSTAGTTNAYWRLFGENIKAIPSGNVRDNAELVSEYSSAFSQALKNNNPEKYNDVLVSADGVDLSDKLVDTILHNKIPANAQNAGKFKVTATQIKNIINNVDVQLSDERAEIYRDTSASATPEEGSLLSPKEMQTVNIFISNLKREAEAKGYDLKNFYKATENINAFSLTKSDVATIYQSLQSVFAGKATDMSAKWLGGIAKYAASDALTGINPENVHVSGENATTDKDSVSTDVDNAIRVSAPDEIYNDVFYGVDGSEIRLTTEEKRAIINYKSSESYELNFKIRSGIPLSDADMKLISYVNSVLDKFPIYQGVVYRNIGFNTKGELDSFIDRYVNNYRSEEGITEIPFTSSSKSSNGYLVENAPYKAHFILKSKAGRDVSNIGIVKEAEVMFKSPTTFDITAVKVDGDEVYLKGTERVNSDGKDTEGNDGQYSAERGNSEKEYRDSRRFDGQVGNYRNDNTDISGAEKQGIHKRSSDGGKSDSVRGGDSETNGKSQTASGIDGRGIRESVLRDNRGRESGERLAADTKDGFIRSGTRGVLDNKSVDEGNRDVAISEREVQPTGIKAFNDFFASTEEAAPATDSNVLNNQSESDIIEESTNKDGVINDKSQSSILARESEVDDGGLRSGVDDNTSEIETTADNNTHRNDSREVLSQPDGNDADRPAERNASKRVHGADDASSVESDLDGKQSESAEISDAEPETVETEVKTATKKRPSNKGNFVITDDIATEFDSTGPNAKDNIEVIELLLKLEDEGRPATAEEKKILAKYKGWGGIDTRYLPYELSSRFGKLFGYEQRRAMQSSQNNAFFTPTKVIDAMYSGLKRMGFKGGNVLETSMGVGNFFGRMPAAISSKSALTGVDLESYTARIAQYLYPGATVINMPFQDVAIRNGSYDLVIGNVPFGQNKISYNKKRYSLHNYFVISSLDKVKDGGIVAVITSASTLESHSIDARSAIMDRADVVACYKLPEKVFSRNASTDVQTDLLILRKRANGAKPSGDSILNTTTTADGLRLNEYFVNHPENILGTLAKGTNAWGEITTVLDNGDFYDKLNAAMKKLPKDLISGKIDLKPVETIVSLSGRPRFFEKNGKVYADDGAGTATEVSKKQASTVRDYIAVRDAYKVLLNAYENGETVIAADGTASIREMTDEDIKPLRDALSKAYDTFYKNHGAITGDGKKKIGTKKSTNNTFLEADADYYLVSGLERYDSQNSKFIKSALFEKDTLRKKRVTRVDAASDSLAVSLNESGKIDFERMQELTGKTEKQLVEELKGEIVLTPEGDYVLTDIYLSGNIYEKLEAVKGKPEFKEQQEMLEKVIPTPKNASDITVKLGANYISETYIEQFAREVLNSHLTIRKDVSGRWVIEGVKQLRYGDIVNVKYGCDAFNAVQLLEKILNDGEITATKKVGTGKDAVAVFDAEMTDVARQKADDIRAAFETWIFSNSDRRNAVVDKYNRTYNNYRPLDYERIAEKLSFDSMDSTLKEILYPHQKKGIARFLFGGNILFAHGVGTGKTFEMIASVMEAKRMGIINKAAMVVPNNKLVDFKNDIAQAYPNAKVLVVDTANKKRQTMLGLVNSNDWDIVLIARTTFTRIPVSRELQATYAAQQLEDLERQIAEAEYDRSVSKRQLKGMITQRDNFEQKLKDLNSDTKRDENSVDFEKLGIDCICVDEAHNYKSVMTPTKLDIKGLVNRSNAQMANDMLMKLDYIRSIDGKIIFGTGTPITNTVSEIYNMMRMVRPDILEDAGIHSLDEWVNTFAKIETITEIGIDNQIKNKSTQIIRSFINVSEMIGMFRQFADIVFTEDVVKNLPKAIYKDVELEGTNEHRLIEKQISEVIAKTKKADLLKVYGQLMSMADAASVDLRMLSGAESEHNIFREYSLDELEYADSKVNTMCDIVLDKYKKSADIKGTQIIFCDKGSGSGTVYSFNLHNDIKQKLIDRGIPEEQIVIIKNQSDAQLEALYDKVNSGEVRVIIGTSQKMAEGLNVQKRVVAIHHPTVTYKPSDWEQGNARGVRAGNINSEVEIYRYLQKNTFDSHKWQAQDRKSEMINKALRGELVAEMEDIGADEDGGAGVDAATAMAITSGNPLVKEKIDIDKEVVRLKTLQRNYLSEVYRYQDAISKNPGLIRQLTTRAENLEQDIALKNKYREKSVTVIKGKTYTKQTDANKALVDAIKTAPKNGQYTKLGTYNGFDIMFKGETGGMGYSLILKGSNEYSIEYAGGSGNNIARFAGALGRLDAELVRVRERIETLKTDLEFAKQEFSKPFEKEADLTEALAKQKDITYHYEHYGEKTAGTENTETIRSSKDVSFGKITQDMPDDKRASILSQKTVNLPKITTRILENLRLFDVDSLKNAYKKDASKVLRKISEQFGVVSKVYTNADIELEFEYSNNSLRESINKQNSNYDVFAEMLSIFSGIVDNAVGVEVHGDKYNRTKREDAHLKNVYVLTSAFINENGDIIPVKLEVKEFNDKPNKLYLSVVLANKKTEFSESTSVTKNRQNNSPSVSNITIPDLIKIVNYSEGHFFKYFPDSMLDDEQIASKRKAISEDKKRVKQYEINDDGNNNIHSSKNITTNNEDRWTTERVEGGKDSNINIADIVKGIRDKFGIPVATGKVTDREASGIYKDKPETIRTRIANDLPTISHELGHPFDKKYNLSKLDSVKELRKAISEDFLNQYEPGSKDSEAVAEFVRIYLKNTNEANRLCPDFYSDFVSSISKEDLKALNEIASSVNEYLSYNISERYDAAIVSSQKKEKVPFREKWHNWYTDWVDAFHPQKEAVDYVEDVTGKTLSGKNNAYVLATNSLNAHTVANFLICEGFRDLDGNVVDAKSFIDSIGMVDAKNVKLLDKYLVLRHSLEWIAPEQEDVTAKRVFADDTLENVEEIKKQIEDIEKEHPEIKTAAENLYEYQNNVLKHFVIPAGGMTAETLETLNRKYPSYVPFYRAVGKKSGFAKGTFANQRSPIMRAKGSGALIISPTESIIKNTEKMVKFAMRNQVMSMWADYAETVDGFGQYMEKVAPDMIPHFTSITDQKARFEDALQNVVSSGEDYFAVSDLFDEIFGDAVADFTPVANANKKIVTVLKNGTPSYYQVHDDAFYHSVAELSPQQTSGLLRIMNAVMQPMKLLITQNNPIFAATNALRDIGTAYKLSEVNNPVTFATQYVKALGGIIANSESYKQYKAMGGGHSSELSANIDNIAKTLRSVAQKDMGKARRLAYSIFRHPVETVASLNDAIESVPRFAEFQRTLAADGDLQKAIFNASDITTNFKRSGKGDTAKVVNRIIMFNNAAIQGLDKTFRTLTAKDPKVRYKTLLKWLLHALIMGIVGYVYNKEVDEEGYKNLSSYKKNNFYNYAIGDGNFISLPKPRENALLDTLTERMLEYLFSGNENAFYDFGGYLSSQLLPPMLPATVNPVDAVHSVLGNTIFGGLVDVGFNHDFKGTPIEGAYDAYLPSNERYSDSTSQLAYWLGQTKLARALDLSPKKIDHLISSYTGILGQVNKALFPMNESRRDYTIGLRNKFVSDSNYSTDVLNRLYDNKDAAELEFQYSPTVENAIEYERNCIVTSYISEMNKAIKSMPDDEQRNGRKFLLRSLNAWNYENTSSQKEMLSCLDGSTVTDDCIITSIPGSKLEKTVNKVKYTYQMTPQEYSEFVNEYLQTIERTRNRILSNSRTAADIGEQFKAADSEVKKELRSKYKEMYSNKFSEVNA